MDRLSIAEQAIMKLDEKFKDHMDRFHETPAAPEQQGTTEDSKVQKKAQDKSAETVGAV